MTNTEPLSIVELVVALDYGQFTLHTEESDPDIGVEVLEEALAGDGIAQRDGLLVVCSPHQNNYKMALRVEIWSAAPPDDLAEWDEAFEASLTVDGDGVTYESPTRKIVNIEVPSGAYRAVITGTGFVARGWPGSTEPGERWRIRLWPESAPVAAQRLKAWKG